MTGGERRGRASLPVVLHRFVLWPAVILTGIWFGLQEPIVGAVIIGGYWVLEKAVVAWWFYRRKRSRAGPRQRRDAG